MIGHHSLPPINANFSIRPEASSFLLSCHRSRYRGLPNITTQKLLASWQFNRLKNADNIILYLEEYMLNCRVLHAPLISLLLTFNKALRNGFILTIDSSSR